MSDQLLKQSLVYKKKKKSNFLELGTFSYKQIYKIAGPADFCYMT